MRRFEGLSAAKVDANPLECKAMGDQAPAEDFQNFLKAIIRESVKLGCVVLDVKVLSVDCFKGSAG